MIIICPHCKQQFMNGSRSLSLNNYLHAILNEIAKEIGSTDIEQVKSDVLFAIGETEYKPNVLTGEETLYRKSTSKMNNTQCSEVTEKIRHWAREFLKMEIPDADSWKQGIRTVKI
jgi:hypothetical protein